MRSNLPQTKAGRKNSSILLQDVISPIKVGSTFLRTAVFVLSCLISWNVSSATTCTFNGTNSGDWTDGGNWSPSAPIAGDVVVISYSGTIINVPTLNIASLTISASISVTLTASAANTVLSESNAAGALVVNSSASLTIGNNLMDSTAGSSTVTSPGTITVASGGILKFMGTSYVDPGGITVNSGGELYFGGSTKVVFSPTAPPSVSGTLTIGGNISGSTSTGLLPSYANGATLQYKLTGNASTGVEFPASIDNLLINNSVLGTRIIMTTNITVKTALTINTGTLAISNKILNITGTANGSANGKILLNAGTTPTSAINITGSGVVGTLYFASTHLGILTMNRSGAGTLLTIGSNITVDSILTMTSGIISQADGSTLTYIGAGTNLSSGSNTSYISFLNTSSSNYGFRIGDGAVSMGAATYILPIGKTLGSGNPNVGGYRPVKITFSGSYFYKIGYMDNIGGAGASSTNVPTAGNHRTGFIITFATSDTVAGYGFAPSYLSSDFNLTPASNYNLNVYNWSSTYSLWNLICWDDVDSTNSLKYLIYNNFKPKWASTGTLVIGELVGTDLKAIPASYSWVQHPADNQWEKAGNWGQCRLYPGYLNSNDTANITIATPDYQPILSSSITINKVSISNSDTLKLAPTAYLKLQVYSSPMSITGASTRVLADASSTIEYTDCSQGANHTNVASSNITYGNLVLSNSTGGCAGNAFGNNKDISGTFTVGGSLTVWGGVNMNISSGSTVIVDGNVLLTTINYGGFIEGGWINNSGNAPLIMDGSAVTLSGSGLDQSCLSCIGSRIHYLNAVGDITVNGSTTVDSLNLGNTMTIGSPYTLEIDNNLTFNGAGIDATAPSSLVAFGNYIGGFYVGQNATATGASTNNGYVNGKVAKSGLTAFTFPIGDGVMYRPAGISGLSASDTYSAQYFYVNPNSVGYNVYSHDPSLDNVSKCEYWMLTNTNSTSAYVTLSYDPAYSCGIGDPNLLKVTGWNTSIWKDLGDSALSIVNQTVTSQAFVSAFNNPFTLSSTDSTVDPLPINLLSFMAVSNGKYVSIDWSTASEVNNNYFTVEKTKDLVDFISVDSQKGAGNSTSVLTYHTLDKSPFKGVSYYRLKQTDYDGKFTYSRLQAVYFGGILTPAITIFPSLVTDKVYLGYTETGTSTGNKTYMLHIFDMKGSEAITPVSVTFEKGSVLSIDLHTLPAGIYMLQLVSDSGVRLEKIIKE